MAIDFNSPTNTTTYATVLTYIRDNIIALAKMNFAGASNIQDESIRWNSASNKFEIYDSVTTSWGDLSSNYDINVDSLNGLTASVADLNQLLGVIAVLTTTTQTITAEKDFTGNLKSDGNLVYGSSIHANNANGNPTISDTIFDIDSNVSESTWESIGPTGSGADNIWTALDGVPSDADWVEICCSVYADRSTGSSGVGCTATCAFREGGSTQTEGTANRFVQVYGVSDNNGKTRGHGDVCRKVPVNSSIIFEAYWVSTQYTSQDIDIHLTGYGYHS